MCGNCRKLRAKNAWFCDLCGSPWEDCIVYPQKKKQTTRSTSRRTCWTEPDHAPWGNAQDGKSPRQSPRNQQPKKQRGRGKGKGKHKQAAQQHQQTLAPPPPPPLGGPEGNPPPWMSMPLPPGAGTVANSTASSSHAEQKLKEVTSLLKKANPESLTPDLQSFVAEETKAATKKDAKSLYTAVDELTKARESLDNALLARSNLMAQWRAFLTMSLERFRQYSDHFQKQEAAHQENISNAKEMLQKAKTDFNTKEEEATVISDEENEMKDTATKESAVKIMEGLNHMTASLQKLSEQAEMEHNAEEERKAKRPRETKNQEAGEGTLPSMQPFGVPGH